MRSSRIDITIFANPDLVARPRELLSERGAGPHRANEAVAGYLRAEQRLGRVRGDSDPDAAASMPLGAIYQYVYWQQFLGLPQQPDTDDSCIAGILATLDRALAPVVEPS